MTKILTPL